MRQRLVTEGCEAALDHRPQPPRLDKIKIKGNVEQKLLELACSEPPRGRCHWTLQLLVDELVVLGVVDTLSTVTVWQALKNKIEFHYTPKHGSWLNMAETEINIMNSQCLNRRVDNQSRIATEVAAWEKKRAHVIALRGVTSRAIK